VVHKQEQVKYEYVRQIQNLVCNFFVTLLLISGAKYIVIGEKKHPFIEVFGDLDLTAFIAAFSKSIIIDSGFIFWFNDLRALNICIYLSSFLSGRRA
jgi:hypothetical protein